MRELRGGGILVLEKISGTDNYADMFTKTMTRGDHERYRRASMNTTARPAGVPERASACSPAPARV